MLGTRTIVFAKRQLSLSVALSPRNACVGMLVVVALLSGACSVHAYDASSACAYARKYYNKVCSDGYYYESDFPPRYAGPGAALPTRTTGRDCAHFVSCCIGSERNEAGGGLDVPKRDTGYGDYGEPGAANLINWLVQHGAQRKTRVDDLSPGDVIGYDTDGSGRVDHVALYLGDGEVAAHSTKWLGGWQLVYRTGFTFIHIPATLGDGTPAIDLPGVPTTQPMTTATVLVMDVSGSMAWTWQGERKIESAKRAALQYIEQVANEPRIPGTVHKISVVTFSGNAELVLPLTSSYAQARQAVIQLGTVSSTNVGAGLTTALRELETVLRPNRYIILLSDGKTNTGLSRQQILSQPVADARREGICIYTVAFGDPGYADEGFLQDIAQGSGCGTYNHATTALELFGTYIKVRHRMLGSNRIADFSSGASPVTLLPGQTLALGAFQLTAPAQELHYTLAWSEPGRLRVTLVDPSGEPVTASYPGAVRYSGAGFEHVTVQHPRKGIWNASAASSTSFLRGVQYYAVASARTGGVVIPYHVPDPICITILGREICIPVPALPTALVVGLAVIALSVALYMRFLAP